MARVPSPYAKEQTKKPNKKAAKTMPKKSNSSVWLDFLSKLPGALATSAKEYIPKRAEETASKFEERSKELEGKSFLEKLAIEAKNFPGDVYHGFERDISALFPTSLESLSRTAGRAKEIISPPSGMGRGQYLRSEYAGKPQNVLEDVGNILIPLAAASGARKIAKGAKAAAPTETIVKAARKKAVTPEEKLLQALRRAKRLTPEQKNLYKAERAKRFSKAESIGRQVGGEQGFYAQLASLKGEMPKVEFKGIRTKLTQDDVNSLFNKIEYHPMPFGDRTSAKSGLIRTLEGAMPRKSEVRLLEEVFGKAFTENLLKLRSGKEKLFDITGNLINIPKTVMATGDLSAPLRQGIFFIGRPKQFVPAFKDMFKYAFSEKAYIGLMDDIAKRPTFRKMRESGLSLTDLGTDLTKREEAIMSNLPERVPILGKVARGSNRAYSGFLNKLRADVFDDLAKRADKLGVLEARPQALDDIAELVNTGTGRGNLGRFERAAPILNATFFSPRLMASRFQLLNPAFYVKLDPFVRKEALKSLVTFGGAVGSILGLAKMSGAKVGTDPRSADFGKMKFGNTRYDIFGGFQQYAVLASRLATGEMVSSTTGREYQLGEGYKTTTRKDIIERFFQSKENPVVSFATALLEGKTAVGEDVNIPAEVIDRFVPMVWQDMYELEREWGPEGIAMGMPGFFGVGSQTYGDQIPMLETTPSGRETVKFRQQPEIGETILNKLLGSDVSNIEKSKWGPLTELKNKETQRDIELNKIKQQVLETGKPQRFGDTIVYMQNGVVKTKRRKGSSFEAESKSILRSSKTIKNSTVSSKRVPSPYK